MDIPEIGYHREFNYGALKLDDLQAMAAENAPAGTRNHGAGVPIMRFDDVFDHKRLKLMKIDVEGMEVDVLAGAQREHRVVPSGALH